MLPMSVFISRCPGRKGKLKRKRQDTQFSIYSVLCESKINRLILTNRARRGCTKLCDFAPRK
jgi:hypothetical protein